MSLQQPASEFYQVSASGEVVSLPEVSWLRPPGDDNWKAGVAWSQRVLRLAKPKQVRGITLVKLERAIQGREEQGERETAWGLPVLPAVERDALGRPFLGRLDVSGDCEWPVVIRLHLADTSAPIGDMERCEITARCRRCPSCLKERQRQWAIRSIVELASAREATLLTLTVKPGWLREAQSRMPVPRHGPGSATTEQKRQFLCRELSKETARFRRTLRDRSIRQPCDLRYFQAFEFGELRGRVHAHCLIIGRVLPREVVREAWMCRSPTRKRMRLRAVGEWRRIDNAKAERARCGVFRIGNVDVKRVLVPDRHGDAERKAMPAIRYVAKYVGKTNARVYSSRFFGRPRQRAEFEARQSQRKRYVAAFGKPGLVGEAKQRHRSQTLAIARSTREWMERLGLAPPSPDGGCNGD